MKKILLSSVALLSILLGSGTMNVEASSNENQPVTNSTSTSLDLLNRKDIFEPSSVGTKSYYVETVRHYTGSYPPYIEYYYYDYQTNTSELAILHLKSVNKISPTIWRCVYAGYING